VSTSLGAVPHPGLPLKVRFLLFAIPARSVERLN
jgi:hypothetical protein